MRFGTIVLFSGVLCIEADRVKHSLATRLTVEAPEQGVPVEQKGRKERAKSGSDPNRRTQEKGCMPRRGRRKGVRKIVHGPPKVKDWCSY